jgi:hypothetical protein
MVSKHNESDWAISSILAGRKHNICWLSLPRAQSVLGAPSRLLTSPVMHGQRYKSHRIYGEASSDLPLDLHEATDHVEASVYMVS